MDDRAVSAVLGYVMVLGIVTLLISGLFLATGNFVESQHERAVRSEFEVVGNRVAADIAAVDRLALAAGSNGQAELVTDLPVRAAGKSYDISISTVPSESNVYFVNLTAHNLDVEVEVRVKSKTPLVDTTVSGGDVRVFYNGSHVEVQDA